MYFSQTTLLPPPDTDQHIVNSPSGNEALATPGPQARGLIITADGGTFVLLASESVLSVVWQNICVLRYLFIITLKWMVVSLFAHLRVNIQAPLSSAKLNVS